MQASILWFFNLREIFNLLKCVKSTAHKPSPWASLSSTEQEIVLKYLWQNWNPACRDKVYVSRVFGTLTHISIQTSIYEWVIRLILLRFGLNGICICLLLMTSQQSALTAPYVRISGDLSNTHCTGILGHTCSKCVCYQVSRDTESGASSIRFCQSTDRNPHTFGIQVPVLSRASASEICQNAFPTHRNSFCTTRKISSMRYVFHFLSKLYLKMAILSN